MKNRINDYIRSHKEEMLRDLAELVAIPSVRGEAQEGAPFGQEPKNALNKMLELCSGYGFRTECVADVVGRADLGDGEPALGILAHMDVVPVEPANWKTDPFTMTEKNGTLFGRGVIDDKGPAVAALYAMRAIKELGIPLKKSVRLLFGTDEENGSGDMRIYLKHEQLPPAVFTPDGSFPVINIEKGMMRSHFKGEIDGTGKIISFVGGSIPNAVPDKASAVVEGITADEVRSEFADIGAEFSVSEENGAVIITAVGKSAHASTPESGINAVTAMIKLLNRLGVDGRQGEILRGLEKYFPFGETDGESVGFKCSDHSGALTCVFSIFSMDRNGCSGTIDVRFPCCTNLSEVEKAERSALTSAGCEFAGFMGDEPHCVDENSDFVQALLRVYEQVEGEKGHCIAIGGGTYVHNVDGGVAFGAERGDTDYHMHGADEFITVEELLKDAVLYAMAVIEICK